MDLYTTYHAAVSKKHHLRKVFKCPFCKAERTTNGRGVAVG